MKEFLKKALIIIIWLAVLCVLSYFIIKFFTPQKEYSSQVSNFIIRKGF